MPPPHPPHAIEISYFFVLCYLSTIRRSVFGTNHSRSVLHIVSENDNLRTMFLVTMKIMVYNDDDDDDDEGGDW